jgi:hypothetical protein
MDILFNDLAELKLYIKAYKSLTIDTMAPFIEEAQQRYITEILGADLLTALVEAYQAASITVSGRKLQNNGSVMDADLFTLLPYVQKPLAKLTLGISADRMAISLGETGYKSAQDNAAMPASSGQIWHYKEEYFNAGYNDLESLIQFLQENADDYTGWASTSEYADTLAHFINTAKDFTKYYPKLNNSRRIFANIKGCMGKIENFIIKPELGPDFYDEIKAEILASNISADTLAILPLIQAATACLTIAKALKEMVAELSNTGLVITQVPSIINRSTTAAPGSLTAMVITEAEKDGRTYLRELKKYLDTNASAVLYPTYYASDQRTDLAETENPVEFINDTDNKYFASF